ncbi:hypothetical protein [Nostoc linckia]|nr:hypothetical protein [Nostoc linckia]
MMNPIFSRLMISSRLMSRTDSPAKRDPSAIASRSESKSDVQHIHTAA